MESLRVSETRCSACEVDETLVLTFRWNPSFCGCKMVLLFTASIVLRCPATEAGTILDGNVAQWAELQPLPDREQHLKVLEYVAIV